MIRISLFFVSVFNLLIFSSLSFSAEAVERIAPRLSELIDRQSAFRNDAIVLHKEKRISLDLQGNTTSTVYRAIKINSRDAARDFSQISIHFNSHFDDLQLDFARVRRGDGSVLELDNDAVQIQTLSQSDFYQDGRLLVFSLPAVEENSIIEYQATYHPLKPKVAGELMGSSFFHSLKSITSEKGLRVDPVYESVIRIEIPDSKQLRYEISTQGVRHSKKHSNGKTVHRWTANKMESIIVEPSMPALTDLAPFIEYSTLRNWKGIDQWAHAMFEPTFDVDKQISKVVEGISAKNLNREETIFAVYEYLQKNIRYVFAHVDRGGVSTASSKLRFGQSLW